MCMHKKFKKMQRRQNQEARERDRIEADRYVEAVLKTYMRHGVVRDAEVARIPQPWWNRDARINQ